MDLLQGVVDCGSPCVGLLVEKQDVLLNQFGQHFERTAFRYVDQLGKSLGIDGVVFLQIRQQHFDMGGL